MRNLKTIAAAMLAALALSACVGFVVPVPTSTDTQQPRR
jgi:hypothetical protein